MTGEFNHYSCLEQFTLLLDVLEAYVDTCVFYKHLSV